MNDNYSLQTKNILCAVQRAVGPVESESIDAMS